MKMDADSSGTQHRDSRGSRSRSRREREYHGRSSERDSRKKEHKIPYFADEVREQDRLRRLRQRAHQSTRRTRSRSRSQSSIRESRHRRHRQRSRSRNRSRSRSSERKRRQRSRSRSSERRRRQRSPHRYNPPPKIINYYVQVPPQDFYGMSGMQQSFGYQRLPRPPPFPPAPYRYRQRPPFIGVPRFGYRNAGRPPY
uniref:Female-specific protein transformer n=1 Tax=Drosophila melanogaster TaxID=7227 RepID=TRSF_DROME